MIRTLRRRVIIREYDYQKVRNQALCNLFSIGSTLYDRAEFTPLDRDSLEKLQLVEILKGRQFDPLAKIDWNSNIPAMILHHLKDYLYDKRYYNWRISLDDDGYICVQSRKNTPKSRIGLAVFEKDLESRL